MWISTWLKFITELKTLLYAKRSGSTLPVTLTISSGEKGKTNNYLCCCWICLKVIKSNLLYWLESITKEEVCQYPKRSGSTLPVTLKTSSGEKGKTYNCLCCCWILFSLNKSDLLYWLKSIAQEEFLTV